MMMSMAADTTQDGLTAGAVWSLQLTDNADAWIRPH